MAVLAQHYRQLKQYRQLKAILVATVAACTMATLGTSRLTAALGDTRTLALYNIHNKETTTVLFKKDGKWVPGAKDKLDYALRDWRRDEKTNMDPAVLELLWDLHTELGSKEPIHVISAFRSRASNDMLRQTVGGQASESRHILGKAVDVHFPDVALKTMRYSALIREKGGVGYYPTSALPFVHIDTDRVRHWPRMPRYELALLFPQGKSQHQPADGGPISIEDVKVAQGRYRDLSVQVASYHDFRKAPKVPIALADAEAAGTRAGRTVVAAAAAPPQIERTAAPQLKQAPDQIAALIAAPAPANRTPAGAALLPTLIEPPRVIDRPSRLGPTQDERARLTAMMQLATQLPAPRLVAEPAPAQRPSVAAASALPSLSGTQPSPPVASKSAPPRVAAIDKALADKAQGLQPASLTDAAPSGWGNGFAPATAFDEEHPDELSYRPFPIAPFMTLTASADDPALVQLIHPDIARTLELLDQTGGVPPMKLRPGAQTAALLWAQQFSGDAVTFAALSADPPAAGVSTLANRRVSTVGR
jgi:uncharacterized protein YcbK (DUF882 family)